jgi:hypothetical protein
MIEQIQNTCGIWPPTHEKLVNDYLKPFVKFIKSIDLTDLQWHVNINSIVCKYTCKVLVKISNVKHVVLLGNGACCNY